LRPGIEALTALPLLVSFSAAQISTLNDFADLARVGPNEELFRAGEKLDDLHILLSGFVAETRAHAERDAFTDIRSPVTSIGFASAMLGTASPIGARTITTSRLIIIPAAELWAMIREEPKLCVPFLEHALASVQEQTLELCRMKLNSSVQRLATFLLGLVDGLEMTPARFVLPYEKRFLAAKIGCSQENLSRAFAALRRLGVETKSSLVVIKDISALRAFAGLLPRGHATD
jgi:CRP/FNR family transcriptional activator FtrB